MIGALLRWRLVLLFFYCSICVVLLYPAVPCHAGGTVRIGYIDYEGFISKDAQGTYSGYGVDLLKLIAERTGWKYEFIFDTWTNQLARLKSGEIDFVCHAQITEARRRDYLFSRYSSGMESSVLYVRADDDRYYYNDFSALNGMRIAVLSGSYQTETFKDYAKSHGFTFTSVPLASGSECFAALDKGQVDGVAMGSLAFKNGYKVACRYGSEPFYFMSGKTKQALMHGLDEALNEILGESPYFQMDLYERHYGTSDAAKNLNLTRWEKTFIKNAGPIRVGQLLNRRPLSFLDETTGRLTGINEDILALIAHMTGLKFVAEPLALGEKPIDVITRSDRFDMIMGVMDSASFRENPAIILSKPFFESTLTVVKPKNVRYNPDSPYNVAVKLAFSSLQDYLRAKSPQYTFLTCATDEACLQAISSGEADITMQNVHVLNYLLQKPQYANLEMLPLSFLSEKSCIMLLAKTSPTLLSILNKAIYSLPSSEVDKIVVANTTAKPYLLTWKDILYKYRIPFIAISLLLLLCLLLFAKLLLSRQRHVRELRSKNAQLEDAVNQAQQANTAKSHFLTRMSHEIRTPMNAIVGLTVLATRHKECTEKIKEYLTKIDSSAKILLNIINDVLDMSAIENEKLHIANAEFNLPQLLNNISSIYYAQCRSKGIDFIMGVDITEETVIGDALRVNQVLMNLVSNAYKFTERGGRIEISVSQTELRGNTVFMRFQVRDTGQGMSKDMLARIFKPFEQESALTAQKSGGSGLGLSITKNLVDMMRGMVRVSSTLGEGTTFTVELPFGVSLQNTTVDLQKIQHMRALVVDDDRDARLYTGVVLDRIGIRYDVAESGEEALRMVSEQNASSNDYYSVYFVDWKMPGMSGIELTRKIRSRLSEGTGVIIVSAYDLSEIEEEAKAAGTDLFISKPLFQSSVFNALLQVADGFLCRPKQIPHGQYDFTGHRVLLAEDQELNAAIATELLAMVNLEVDRAENGQQAVIHFAETAPGTYDLILMDVQMPIMDGYEATRTIRALNRPDAATIPIFAMTADAFTADISLALSAGMNGHIAKPIDTDLLYRTIHNVIGKSANMDPEISKKF